jgi:flagellar hook assembly protein FlgD
MSFLRIPGYPGAATAITKVLVLALVTASAHAAPPANADILGSWKLTRVLDSSEIASMDDQEAAKLVGKTVLISAQKVSLAGESCPPPVIERHREPAAKYIRENAHAPVGRLGLPDTVMVIHLGCTEAFVKGKGKIVFYWDGFFYDAVKQMATKR